MLQRKSGLVRRCTKISKSTMIFVLNIYYSADGSASVGLLRLDL